MWFRSEQNIRAIITKSKLIREFTFSIDSIFQCLFFILVLLYMGLLFIPIIALGSFAGIDGLLNALKDNQSLQAIKVSLSTSLISLSITFLLGTPTVFYLCRLKSGIASKLVDVVIQIPIVMPPASAGIALILVFGKNGTIGRFLEMNNIQVIYTATAVIIAQVFVSSAFYVQVLKAALIHIPEEIYEVSYVLGASKTETLWKVILPIVKKSMVSGLIIAWIRSLGEFGATIMFAGNLPSKTRTIPLQIYTLTQSNISSAAGMAAILYIASFIFLILAKSVVDREE